MLRLLKRVASRIRAFARSADLDRDFEAELEAHLAMLTEDNVRRGMAPDEARRAARIRLGPPSALRERHRDVRGLPAVDGILQDVRFACRLIGRDRWFSAAIVAVLALGIGANTVGFTIVNATLLRPLPIDGSDRIYTVSWQNRAGRRSKATQTEFHAFRSHTRSFTTLAGYAEGALNLSDDRALPEEARATWVTGDVFGILASRPLLGRGFVSHDDAPGAQPVVLLGHGLWKSRYGGDPHIVGQALRVNGQPATIIGVMPEGMRFPDNTEIWMPLAPGSSADAENVRRLQMFGALQRNVDRRQAYAELSGVAQRLIAADPAAAKDLVGVRVETFTERFIGGAGRPMIITIMGAVVFVLLIACANVANMLLSRAAFRGREVALRMAMGATRWRIVRQLLIESFVIACAGGAIGLLLAVWGVRLFDTAMQQSGLPYWVVFSVDAVVILYVAAICMLTAVVFGLAPALQVSKTSATVVLKEAGRGASGSPRERWLSAALVMTELALTVVLLAGSGVMIRSLLTLYAVDVGVDTSRLMTMDVRLPAARYPTSASRRAFFERLEPRLTAIPGIEAAAVTTGVPSRDGGERLLEVDGPARAAAPVFVSTVTITPQFFETAGVPLVRGRDFDDRDGAPGTATVIVNERLAAQFFPGQDPLGRRLRFTRRNPPPGTPDEAWRTVVGISGRILHGSSLDRYENAVVYIPLRHESPASASLLLRSALPPGSVMDAVRREVQAIDRDQPVFTIQTLAQLLERDRWWYRTWGALFTILAAVALLLSTVGLYAVMAYAVTQRTQEIGLRMAVGAQPRQVTWLILKRGLVHVAIGLTLGLAIALAVNRILRLGLADLGPNDPVSLAAIAVLLTVVSLAACLVPVRRATRIDPVVALRAE